jgi:F-type H+-transporting ATPase subunit gamma
MASGKEIRTKIKSVESTRKITKAMQMVAASKMRKAQDRMRAARPYGDKIRRVAANLSHALTDYRHPYLAEVDDAKVKRVGLILVSSDKGLCGGLNTNLLRLVLNQMKEWDAKGIGFSTTCIGSKGLGFMQRAGAQVVAQLVGLGDTPRLERLIGPVKALLDMYVKGEIDKVYIGYTRFINTMRQEPVVEQLLPLSGEEVGANKSKWDYLYEPEPKPVIDTLLLRYVEALIYQAVAENMASEQSARMVAMKSASDNAKNVIDELNLVYNKARQAAITTELSEIVSGAAAV